MNKVILLDKVILFALVLLHMQVQLATVTQKGQITIPLAMRNALSISPYSRVKVFVSKKSITVQPLPSIFDIAPIGIAPKGKNALKAREYMAKNYKRV